MSDTVTAAASTTPPAQSASTAATATASAASTQAASSAASLNYDAFLQLLIAQIQNQDPTDPVDSTDQIAQLATFSNVEQAIQTNTKLDALMTTMALSQADGVIGRTITSADGTISGEVSALRVVSGGAVAVLTSGQELPLGAGVTVT